ncbi:hypothetical protein [Vannielia litorea]|uniref:hypothetical protein n=1 Tax=Vannielia litorea TaxID=1217970 RepID=UPI001BD16331|nr:hypothetical protein [Vannielia litorea]MBS8225901.1 hypothetical protein [Vannielia litorea]
MDSTTEGRLIAQRQMIAMMVAGRGREEILHWLEEAMRDGQEDPGAVNEEAFAIEGALADERQALAREIRLRSGG